MQVFELVGFDKGLQEDGVIFLEPAKSFQLFSNGFVYRQLLQSRLGYSRFGNRLSDKSRVTGIFVNIKANGSQELLATSQKYLYTYNESNNQFDQIPFAGSAGEFGLMSPESYISGTTYPDKDGNNRFVFTGKGMTDIYYYDGTNVKSFTQDNTDYAAPSEGAMTKAIHVKWFGERLNFFAPTIDGTIQLQSIFYSGIRDSSGNGDKFNVTGSGFIAADTFDALRSPIQRGDLMIIAFSDSFWALEKTRDVFNPYFIRQIPSVLGCDADFSVEEWNGEVKAFGRNGLVISDGRQTLRFDNAIPNFVRDRVNPTEIQQTYAGFNRYLGQFMYSYRSNTSQLSSNTQDNVLVYNYEESTWSTYDMRFSCFGSATPGTSLTWNDINSTNRDSWATWNTTQEIWNKIGVTQGIEKMLAGSNEGYVFEMDTDYHDYYGTITDITKASEAVITIADHSFQINDIVYIDNVIGMTEINEQIAVVTAIATNTITVSIDSTEFSTYSAGGYAVKTINFNLHTNLFNPFRAEGRRVFVSHMDFLVDRFSTGFNVEMYSNENFGDFLTTTITPDSTKEEYKQWITVSVNEELDFFSFGITATNYKTQLRIYSIRMYMERGGMKV